MELKAFIKETIKDISEAISELSEEVNNNGLVVNPIPDNHTSENQYIDDGRLIQKVEFNLQVTASEKKDAGGGIQVSVLKAGINNETNNQTVSNLKFSITVVLPSGSR